MKERFLTMQSHKLLSVSSLPPSLSPRHTHTHAHKKPILCPSEHTDVPLGIPTVWIGGFLQAQNVRLLCWRQSVACGGNCCSDGKVT